MRVGDQHTLVAVFDDAGVQVDLVRIGQRLVHLRQPHQHADRIAGLVVAQRDVQLDPDDFAALLAAPHFGVGAAVSTFLALVLEKQFGDIAVVVVLGVQEQDVLAQRLGGRVAEHLLRAKAPCGQVAGQVQFQHGVAGVGIRLGQPARLGQRGVQRGQRACQRLARFAAGLLAQCEATLDRVTHGRIPSCRPPRPASTGRSRQVSG
jgi:hypothetical protein